MHRHKHRHSAKEYLAAVEQQTHMADEARAHRTEPVARRRNVSGEDPIPLWRFIGPRNVEWDQINVSGRVNAVAYSPSHPWVLYAGAAGGGVWRSPDSGVTWVPLSDTWPGQAVASIAVDPSDEATVYAGTGDFPDQIMPSFSLMKTQDYGVTWTNLGVGEFGDTPVTRVLVDPDNPNVVLATAMLGGMRRSVDAGVTWNSPVDTGGSPLPVLTWTGAATIAQVPVPPAGTVRHYYAAGVATDGSVRLFTSQDRGAHWASLSHPLSAPDQFGLGLTTSPTSSDVVYLLSASDRKVFRSTNAGATWTDITGDLPVDDDTWKQGAYDFVLQCSSLGTGGPDVLYLGLIDVFQTTDLRSWRNVGVPHPDQHAMAVNPTNPNELLMGCDGGVYRFTFRPADGTWGWTGLNNSLGVTQIYQAAVADSDTHIVLCGTQDNGAIAGHRDFNTWGVVVGGDVGSVAVEPLKGDIQYAAGLTIPNFAVTRGTLGWRSTANVTPPEPPVEFIILAQDPFLSYMLYCGVGQHLFAWDNALGRFIPVGTQELAGPDGIVLSVASNSSAIYAGSSDGQLWLTLLAGASWGKVSDGSPSLPPDPIGSVSMDPNHPQRVVVGLRRWSGHAIWSCDDTLAATPVWADISSRLPDGPVNSVARDPRDPANSLYIGTMIGVFFTNDRGAHWNDLTVDFGLPRAEVTDIRVLADGFLQTATFGRGLWRAHIQSLNPTLPYLDILVGIPGIGTKESWAFEWAGVRGTSSGVETYSIDLGVTTGAVSLEYMASLQGLGDTAWFQDGIVCGIRGSLRLVEGFAIRLTGPDASQYNVFYQAYVHGSGATDVFQDGDFCGSRGTGIQVQAMRVWVVKR